MAHMTRNDQRHTEPTAQPVDWTILLAETYANEITIAGDDE